jgi:hypothetical protein
MAVNDRSCFSWSRGSANASRPDQRHGPHRQGDQAELLVGHHDPNFSKNKTKITAGMSAMYQENQKTWKISN